MVRTPVNWLLPPPICPGVWRNLPDVLAHCLYVLSGALHFWPGSCLYPSVLHATYLFAPHWNASWSLLWGSRAMPVLPETHPLASKPPGLLKRTSSPAGFLSVVVTMSQPPRVVPSWWCLLAFPVETSLMALGHLLCPCFVGLNGFSVFSVWKFGVSLV